MKQLLAYLLILSLTLTLVKTEDASPDSDSTVPQTTEAELHDHDADKESIDSKSKIEKEHLSDPAGLITYNAFLPLCYTFFLQSDILTIETLTDRQNDSASALDEEEGMTLAASMYMRHYAASHFDNLEDATISNALALEALSFKRYDAYIAENRDQVNEDLKDYIEFEHQEEQPEDDGPSQDDMQRMQEKMASMDDDMSKEQWDREIAKELGYTYEEWLDVPEPEAGAEGGGMGELGEMMNQAGLGDLTNMPNAEEMQTMTEQIKARTGEADL